MSIHDYDILIVGGGHAGAEAAWAAANMGASVGLVTMDPARIGQMSCNPAIGGLAKGQMVREIDALGGLMGLAADATGIQFRMLNASKGPAVRGPRCQSDKYAYAAEVQRLLRTRENLHILAGTVNEFLIEQGRCVGIRYTPRPTHDDDQPTGAGDCCGDFGAPENDRRVRTPVPRDLRAAAVVLTTGTFMRGLMHTGQQRTPGGRVDEAAAKTLSGNLERLGFHLGRLKTGTPPRLAAETIDLHRLEEQPGDAEPTPFSDLTTSPLLAAPRRGALGTPDHAPYANLHHFPHLDQRPCWITHTSTDVHGLIRDNLHRAPMYNGQVDTVGPRYCPSIEDKVVRFADKSRHHVFLEPESLSTNEIYCNGISTSLPQDVQDRIVAALPGCERATILRYGYAVEYDMVWPHQIDATTMTKPIPGLFLAGQINGTTGYEEAAGQGLLAGLNAVRYARGEELIRLRRDQAYIGVMMDDLVTKVPREPYRMFTSRAEHRLMLRSDNAPDRLTPFARELGLIDDVRWAIYQQREAAMHALRTLLNKQRYEGVLLADWVKRPEVDADRLLTLIAGHPDPLPDAAHDRRIATAVLSEIKYAAFIERHRRQQQELAEQESRPLPTDLDYDQVSGLRAEARQVLQQFRPATLGQAGRLAGINPADLTVLAMTLRRMCDV